MSEITLLNTKIIATVGPAISSYEMLLAMATAGVNVFRLNMSHADHSTHLEVINHLIKINRENNFHFGILADLQGPKLRVGRIKDNALELKTNDEIIFTNTPCEGTAEGIYMSYELFPKEVAKGDKVLVDDGKLMFEVLDTDRKSIVRLKVLFGGTLSSNKGVNLPDTQISLPSLTEKDLFDLDFVLQHPIHWIALSFVRKAEDITDLRKRLEAVKHPAKIVAKIEKPEALNNIDEVIQATDAVMVARGDLGVEVPIEKLPGIQKEIVRRCIEQSRPVIVATQMMESMITNPSPTRAEVTDVANAVLQGADAVMLSAETSVGKHPVRVIEAMSRIIRETEKHYQPNSDRLPKLSKESDTFLADVLCFNAVKTTYDLDAKAIIGMTTSGFTAFKISSFRPRAEIFIFSTLDHMLSTLNLVWGVQCFKYFFENETSTDQLMNEVVVELKKLGLLDKGDIVVNTGTVPIQVVGRTNMMKISVVE
ncbi:MAG: pyruvate kinase [Saprospiraceae bacterium]